jgi:hypothetical protein
MKRCEQAGSVWRWAGRACLLRLPLLPVVVHLLLAPLLLPPSAAHNTNQHPASTAATTPYRPTTHLLALGPLDAIVCALRLVGCDECRVVDAGQGHQVLHQRHQLLLQLKVQHLGALHGVSQVHACEKPWVRGWVGGG